MPDYLDEGGHTHVKLNDNCFNVMRGGKGAQVSEREMEREMKR